LVKRALAHPLTRTLDIDSPETTRLRRIVIEQKPFLKSIYKQPRPRFTRNRQPPAG
jgi:hypothetical protein